MAFHWTRARALALQTVALLALAATLSLVAGCATREQAGAEAGHAAERTARATAALSPSALSAEFAAQTRVPTTAITGGVAPCVAVAAGNALVAWSVTYGVETTIYAIRVDLTGAPIDAAATLVAHWSDPVSQGTALGVGTDGNDFLVVYTRSQLELGVRVRGSDGALLDDVDNRLVLGVGAGAASIGATGGRWLASWAYGQATEGAWLVGGTVRAVVGLDNLPLDPSTGGDAPSVAVGGGFFLVTANHRAMRYRASDGVLLDRAPISFANRSAGPAPMAAYDGTNFFVVWSTQFAVTPLYGARIRASDGAVLNPDDDANDASGSLVLLDDGRYRGRPQPFFVDGKIDVTYLDINTQPTPFNLSIALRMLVVNPASGRRTDASAAAPGTLLAANVPAVAVAMAVGPTGSGLVVTSASDTFAVSAQTLAPAQGALAMAPGSPTPVSRVGRNTAAVQVASNGTDWLVSSIDVDPSSAVLRANRVRSADHAVADPTPLVVADLAAASNVTSPAPTVWGVASNGGDYVVAWLSGQSVFARTIGADGTLGEVILLASTAHGGTAAAASVAIACDGERYLVAWTAQSPTAVRARRFTTALAPIDASDLVVTTLPYAPQQQGLTIVVDRAAPGDDATFVVGIGATTDRVTYARVDSRLGATPDSVTPPTIASVLDSYDLGSAWASNGTDALVVWNDGVPVYPQRSSFFGARLAGAAAPAAGATDGSAGSIGTPTALAAAPSTLPPVTALAWDGKAYVFASLDDDTAGIGARSLRLTRLAPAPALLDPPGAAPGIVAASLTGAAPSQTTFGGTFALGRGPGGTALVAYLAWDDASLGHVARARVLSDDWDGVTLPDAGAWDAGFPQPGGDDDAGDAGPPFEVDATLAQDAEDDAEDDAENDAAQGADAGDGIILRRDAGTRRDASAVHTSSGDGTDGGLTGAAMNPAAWPYAASPLDERTSSGCGCRVGGDGDGSVSLAGWLGGALAVFAATRRRRTRRDARTVLAPRS